jgi:hypothetical protein
MVLMSNDLLAFFCFAPPAIFAFIAIKKAYDKSKKEEFKINEQSRIQEEFRKQKIEEEIQSKIPTICPNCKNTNSKKLEICEWCGSNVI